MLKSIFNGATVSATAVILAAVAMTGCGDKHAKQTDTADTLTDSRDGKKYKTVQIGNQVWMAENLNYEAEGSRCYGDDPANCEKYGRLYDWETAMKVCPKGWRLPTGDDGKTLVNFVGGEETVGTKLKSKAGWHNEDGVPMGNGTDDYGFSALPGGYGGSSDGNFYGVGYVGHWWSSSEYDNGIDAYYRVMHYNFETAHRGINLKSGLFSVRCIKDTDEQNAAEKDAAGVEAQNEEARVIELEKLTLKGDVYYLNNAPFTGKARKEENEDVQEWEMKDGKPHGTYTGHFREYDAIGTYEDGKKQGEWKNEYSEYKYILIYKDDKEHGEWKAFDKKGELYKTQTWENGVLIRENGELVSETTETAQNEEAGVIELEKLTLKGDVHYLNNAPYTGTVRREEDEEHEEWEMKDGKFHGKYWMQRGEDLLVNGNYKDGKKHGEWQEDGGEYSKTGTYKDGNKHGQWLYIAHELNDGRERISSVLVKGETWENGVLIETNDN